MSLAPAAKRLAELIPNKVVMAPDVVGEEVTRLKGGLGEGEALLLENVRFYKEEEKNDPAFAARLAEGIDIFVNDAFGSSHRAHASVVGIADIVPVKAAGYLMKKEVDYLKKAVHKPVKPYVGHPRRGQSLGQDRDHREPSRQGRPHPHRRGHGLHFPQGPGARRRQVARRGRSERGSRWSSWRRPGPTPSTSSCPRTTSWPGPPRPGPRRGSSRSCPSPSDLHGRRHRPQDDHCRTPRSSPRPRRSSGTAPWASSRSRTSPRGRSRIAEAVAASGRPFPSSAAAIRSPPSRRRGSADRISHISTGGGASLEYRRLRNPARHRGLGKQ